MSEITTIKIKDIPHIVRSGKGGSKYNYIIAAAKEAFPDAAVLIMESPKAANRVAQSFRSSRRHRLDGVVVKQRGSALYAYVRGTGQRGEKDG